MTCNTTASTIIYLLLVSEKLLEYSLNRLVKCTALSLQSFIRIEEKYFLLIDLHLLCLFFWDYITILYNISDTETVISHE